MLFLSRLVTPDVSQFDKKTQRWIISPITFYLIFFCFEILFWNYYAFNTFSLIYTHSLFHATGGELFGNKKQKQWLSSFPVTLALKNGNRRMTSSLVLSCRRRKRKCACDKNQLSSFCSLLYFSHPSTSCTWQSSCSRTRWFSLTRMSLKEIKSKYVPRPTNKSYLQLENLLWDCLRILSASPVSWSCCPAPSPLHFACNSRFTEINLFAGNFIWFINGRFFPPARSSWLAALIG